MDAIHCCLMFSKTSRFFSYIVQPGVSQPISVQLVVVGGEWFHIFPWDLWKSFWKWIKQQIVANQKLKHSLQLALCKNVIWGRDEAEEGICFLFTPAMLTYQWATVYFVSPTKATMQQQQSWRCSCNSSGGKIQWHLFSVSNMIKCALPVSRVCILI